MSGAVQAERRYVRGRRCPICNGAAGDRRGAEKRCHGFLSRDGEYAHCSREEHAGTLKLSDGSSTYGHRIAGLCECGKPHGEATPAEASAASGRSSLGRIVAEYDYHDETGALVYQVVRFEPKEFRQRRPDPKRSKRWIWNLKGTRRVLYHLDRVLEADPERVVYVVEGEKDVEALEALGLVATCNPQGAGKWRGVADCAGTALRGRRVVVIADADEPGRRHATDVEAQLRGVAASVHVIEPGRGKDAADWIKAGGTVEEIEATAASAAADVASDAPALEITTPAKPRWLTPLTEFIGKDEPDDDDSEDWIIRDIIPRGEPALLVGPPKSGKTWALQDIAIAVATGTDWLGGAQQNTLGRPGRVLGVVLEDSLRRLGKRLWQLCRARGIRPNEDPVLSAHLSLTRAPLRLPDKQDERDLAAELKRWKPDLVLIDNLTRVMVGDQNKPEPTSLFTKVWIQLCTDIGAAIVFLHHTGKAGEWKPGMNTRDVFELIRGSSDILAAARNAVVMFPIRAGTDGEPTGLQMSDVRIRGNLDLRRESLVLGFEQSQGEDGRWSARLRDCGEVSKVRAEIVAKRKEAAAAKRNEEAAAENHRRREIALDIIRRNGSCSNAGLATALELKSAQSAAPTLQAMLADGLVVHDSRRGYVFPDPDKEGAQ